MPHSRRMKPGLLVALCLAGCEGDAHHADLGADFGACTGAPTSGPADDHCEGDGGLVVGDVDPALCDSTGSGTGVADYGPTMYGTTAHDDDCKYVLRYTVDPICEGEGMYYTLTATYAKDGSPVTGAAPRAEVFLTDQHLVQGGTTTEAPNGTYKIGPIVFNASGKWTVRFHLFEDCADVEGSPHGHAAFYMTVP